jgi:hypothetical protein
MSETKYTAPPWELDEIVRDLTHDGDGEPFHATIYPADEDVARVSICSGSYGEMAHIVRAVNSHDALVGALRAAEEFDQVGILASTVGKWERVRELRQAALTLAGGEQ